MIRTNMRIVLDNLRPVERLAYTRHPVETHISLFHSILFIIYNTGSLLIPQPGCEGSKH